MTLAIIAVYLLAVLVIGIFSHRFFRGTSEDWFVAARTLGPFILLVSLFGAHMTAFSLLGASGEAYMEGIGVFALMASSSALVTPMVFFFVGTRVWALGKRRGYLTPVQLFRERWGSDALGLLIFFVQIALLVPYLLIGVMGGGLTLTQVTDGQVPDWVGGLVICVVVLAYTTYGGMRGTIWVNVFQTAVLMTLGAIAFWVIVSKLGGLEKAMARVAASHPDMLVRGEHIQPWKLLTWTGHAYSPETLLAKQADNLEATFWAAIRALEENAALARRMEKRMREGGNVRSMSRYDKRAQAAEAHADVLRRLLYEDEKTAAEG